MIPIPAFDELYVISDLHMGGPPGRQIFGQDELLSRFIRHIQASAEGECGLIINGDMVDFLAEPGAVYFDATGAIDKLDKIAERFPNVWSALKDYVQTEKRHLVIVLGNHDIELALPWVRNHLLHQLSGGDPGARRRIALGFDGTGFACTVGSRQVLCLHGNEVDEWNLTDYEKLRRIGVDLIQGRAVEPWTPNAGTKLVIDMMNAVKSEHAFVDLLKPEQQAALRIVLAMRPTLKAKATDVLSILSRRFITTPLRRAFNLLEAEPAPDATERADAERRLAQIMSTGSAGSDSSSVGVQAQRLFDQVEVDFNKNLDPVDLACRRGSGQLGIGSAIIAAFTGEEPHRVAWESVKELASDDTFAVRKIDADFEKIDALAGANFDVVIAGHTHLARILQRRKVGRGWYFNTGTWAWLMRFSETQLESAETFREVFESLSRASSIDDIRKEYRFVRPTVAIVRKNEEPALRNVVPADTGVTFAELKDNQ